MKIIIIGGVAGGATTAARIRRVDEKMCIRDREIYSLKKCTSRLFIMLFPISPGNHHLQPDAKSEAQHINS